MESESGGAQGVDQEKRAEQCERRRRVLGDLLAAEMIWRRLEGSQPWEVLEAYKDACDDWEATVIECYAEAMLEPGSSEPAELQALCGDGQVFTHRSELAHLEAEARDLWIALQPETVDW